MDTSVVSPHRWKFIRSGGVDQVVIRSGADIVHLESLDQKLWVALACPTRGVEFDPRTLDLIDTNDDGRIRPPEMIAATRWVASHFRDPEDLLRGGSEVAVAAINSDTPGGQQLAASVREILALIGEPDKTVIGLTDFDRLHKLTAEQPFNGDGVILPKQVKDPQTRSLVEMIGKAYGWATDRAGEPGIDRAQVDRYLADLEKLETWYAQAQCNPALLPLGEHTVGAMGAVARVADKVDDFYTRCAMAAYDPLAAAALNPPEAVYRSIALDTLDASTGELERMPLAIVRRDAVLPLTAGVNPAYTQALDEFRTEVVEPLLGRALDEMDRATWRHIRERLAPCSAWLASKPDTQLSGLPPARIATPDLAAVKAALYGAIDRDAEATARNARFAEAEKLVRFQRDLVQLLNNFVSFAEFYAGRPAIFQAGTLYLDARSCDLTVEVADLGKHPVLAGLAKAYLAYCECRRAGVSKHIVAVFTAGDVDYLFVGRNGVFYDRTGQDWDATIVKVVENPINIRQAFFSPYKKFSRMIEEQVAKRAATSESGVQGKLRGLMTTAVQDPATPGSMPPASRTRRIDVGTVAALGVAFGSISTVIVAVFAKFVDLGAWIPVAMLGIVLAISGPSMLIAWLKLRQRSLGPILDASGWAINGRMKINIPLGKALSQQARLPSGAEHRLRDPFAETHRGRRLALLLILLALVCVLGWRTGWLGSWLPFLPRP